jgi:hypothetical protein
LFITYHSCAGYLRGGLGDEFPLRALAAHGIAAMCINRFAGSVGGGRNTEAYAVAEAGIGTIVDKLTSEGTIDPARVGVGGSASAVRWRLGLRSIPIDCALCPSPTSC